MSLFRKSKKCPSESWLNQQTNTMSEDTSETPKISVEEIAAAGATGTEPEAPSNVIAFPESGNAPTEAPEAPLECSAADSTPLLASDASETPAVEPTAKPEPKNIHELIASIDISQVSEHEIIVDLIAGIQQLAVRGTVALGLLERMKVQQDSAQDPAAE